MEQTVRQQISERWKSYVDRAKKIHSRMTRDRMEIAKLAVEACDIKHGGGAHWNGFKDIFTLHKFAHDVGIHYKTLHLWVRVFRQIKTQIPPQEWDENNWPAAVRASGKITKKTPPAEIREIYKQERRKNGESLSLAGLSKRMTTYATVLMGFETKDLQTTDLAEVALAAAAIHEWAEKELRARGKRGLNLSKQQTERLQKRAAYLQKNLDNPERRAH